MASKAPKKGEPPPTYTPHDNHYKWAKSIIRSINEENDNITLPTIRLVFDNNTIPITTTSSNNDLFIVQDNKGNIKDHSEIFTTQVPLNSPITYGSIATDESHLQYSQHPHHHPQMTYTCEPINMDNTPNINRIEDYISSSIKTTNNNSIYEFHINTQVQNDSGANRSVTNLISLLHNFK